MRAALAYLLVLLIVLLAVGALLWAVLTSECGLECMHG